MNNVENIKDAINKLRDCIEQAGDGAVSFDNDLCKFVFDYFSEYTNKAYHFPHPLVVRQKNINGLTKRKIYALDGSLLGNSIIYYYEDLSTGKLYYSLSDIKKDFGYNFKVYSYINTSTIFKYIEDIDVIVGFMFRISTNEPGFILTNLFLILDTADGIHHYLDIENKCQSNDKIVTGLSDEYSCCVTRLEYFDSVNYFHNSESSCGQNESLRKALYRKYHKIAYNTSGISYEEFNLEYSKPVIKKNSKTQNIIDELVKVPLKKLGKYDILKVQKRYNSSGSICIISSFDRVNENTSVLRFTAINEYGYYQEDVMRIYCVKNKFYACKLTNDNQWVAFNYKTFANQNFKSKDLIRIDKSLVDNTSFSYYLDTVKAASPAYRSALLLNMIKNPIFERLSKAGLNKLIEYADTNTKISNLKGLLIDSEEKNVFKAIGFNKYQIDKINNTREIQDTIRMLRKFFGNNVLDVDNKTFDNVFELLEVQRKTNYYSFELYKNKIANVSEIIREKDANLYKYFLSTIVLQLTNIMREHSDYDDIIQHYWDYIRMVDMMDEFSNFKISFDFDNPYESIERMHNEASALYALRKDEVNRAAFEKNVEKIRKYEYSPSKSDYVVIIPTQPVDVAKEGIELHHCVKSYIPRIAKGETNILFIRQKEDIEKPFFTVEVDNNAIVQQIHGIGNCNIDTVPGLDKFVKDWASHKKLKLGRITQVR